MTERLNNHHNMILGFPGGSVVKKTHLLMQKMQVQSLGREDTLEEEMATHSVFLSEKFHGQRRLAG